MERSEGDMSLKNPVTLPGIDPGTVRLVAQRLNHYATPGPTETSGCSKFKMNDLHVYTAVVQVLDFLWMGDEGRG